MFMNIKSQINVKMSSPVMEHLFIVSPQHYLLIGWYTFNLRAYVLLKIHLNMFMMFEITGKSSLSRFTTFSIDFTQLTAPLILSPKKSISFCCWKKKCVYNLDWYLHFWFVYWKIFLWVDIDDIIERQTF